MKYRNLSRDPSLYVEMGDARKRSVELEQLADDLSEFLRENYRSAYTIETSLVANKTVSVSTSALARLLVFLFNAAFGKVALHIRLLCVKGSLQLEFGFSEPLHFSESERQTIRDLSMFAGVQPCAFEDRCDAIRLVAPIESNGGGEVRTSSGGDLREWLERLYDGIFSRVENETR